MSTRGDSLDVAVDTEAPPTCQSNLRFVRGNQRESWLKNQVGLTGIGEKTEEEVRGRIKTQYQKSNNLLQMEVLQCKRMETCSQKTADYVPLKLFCQYVIPDFAKQLSDVCTDHVNKR